MIKRLLLRLLHWALHSDPHPNEDALLGKPLIPRAWKEEILKDLKPGPIASGQLDNEPEYEFGPDDRLVAVRLGGVGYGERRYPLPVWAHEVGWDTKDQAYRWANPWHWPPRPVLDEKLYHAPLDLPPEPEERITDRDLLSDSDWLLWEDLSPEKPDQVIAYPPPADDQSARDWVTEELMRRTGGLTRHPMDRTAYPEPPTEADKAAREYAERSTSPIRAYFTHGMSMRYLSELQARAKRKDSTLTTEELMGLRSRGLI